MKGFTKDLDILLPAFRKYKLIEKQSNSLPVSEDDIFEDTRFKNSSLTKTRLKFLREIYDKQVIKGLHPETVYVKCNDIIEFLKSENLINKSQYSVKISNPNKKNHITIVRYDEYTLSQEGLTKALELQRVRTAKYSFFVSLFAVFVSCAALAISIEY